MSSSSNVRNPQSSRSLFEASERFGSLPEWILELGGVEFETFMALTLSVGEVLVMRCFRKAQVVPVAERVCRWFGPLARLDLGLSEGDENAVIDQGIPARPSSARLHLVCFRTAFARHKFA